MTDQTGSYDGGCACGYVRYRMESRPLIVHCCHCSWCQRQNGSAFAVNALIEADRVRLLEGEVVDITVPSPSGKGQVICRCPKCQVALWSYYLVLSGGAIGKAVRFMRVGTLDDPSGLPPDVHIYTSSKQPWVKLSADDLVVDEYYVTKDTWSPQSLQRLEVLLESARN